jgi:hypothetical protein
MSKFNVSEFKQLLKAASGQQREHAALLRQAALSHGTQRAKNRQAVAQVLAPFFSKAGLDLDKVNGVLAHNQAELRRNFQKQKLETAKHSASHINALRGAIELGQKALKHLGNRPPAADSGLSSLISLTTPFLIWEWPHPNLDQLRDSHIEPLNSWAKILIDIPAYSFDNDMGADTKEFSFYFLWTNESDFLAVAKVFSVLSLTGACEAWANSGVLSGDKMNLSIQTSLYPITYWLPVPPGGTINSLRVMGDPLQSQNVLSLNAYGGDWFDDSSDSGVPRIFSATPFGMSYGSGSFGGFPIPRGATALFEVSLKLSWDWQGNTLPDEIIADFADDNLHYNVGCPIVVLQLLTAPPAMA